MAKALKELAHRSGRSFKSVTNETLRVGLALRKLPSRAKRYRVEPASLGGVCPGVDLDRALRIADALEEEAIAKKLEQRK